MKCPSSIHNPDLLRRLTCALRFTCGSRACCCKSRSARCAWCTHVVGRVVLPCTVSAYWAGGAVGARRTTIPAVQQYRQATQLGSATRQYSEVVQQGGTVLLGGEALGACRTTIPTVQQHRGEIHNWGIQLGSTLKQYQ